MLFKRGEAPLFKGNYPLSVGNKVGRAGLNNLAEVGYFSSIVIRVMVSPCSIWLRTSVPSIS